jgi:hypothetical protein
MTSPSGQVRETEPPQRVSTLELFFDLVFVFTITQLTSSLPGRDAAGRGPDAAGLRCAVVDFLVLGIGTARYRALAAMLALAAWPLSVTVSAAAGITLLTAVVAGALAVERRAGHATVEA